MPQCALGSMMALGHNHSTRRPVSEPGRFAHRHNGNNSESFHDIRQTSRSPIFASDIDE